VRRCTPASGSGGSSRADRLSAPRAAPDPPPPKHWTAPGRTGHKGSAKRPAQALRIEGPGSDANQTTRAFVLFASLGFEHNGSRAHTSAVPKSHLAEGRLTGPLQGPVRRHVGFAAVQKSTTTEIELGRRQSGLPFALETRRSDQNRGAIPRITRFPATVHIKVTMSDFLSIVALKIARRAESFDLRTNRATAAIRIPSKKPLRVLMAVSLRIEQRTRKLSSEMLAEKMERAASPTACSGYSSATDPRITSCQP
jgi:hypothetical protein